MIKTVVKDLYRNQEKFNEQTVQISGWIRTLRDSKTIGFMELNDGTFFKSVQVVFEDTLDNFKEITKLPISSSVLVEGEFVPTPEMKQPFEIKATKIVVEGLSDPAYPLQKRDILLNI